MASRMIDTSEGQGFPAGGRLLRLATNCPRCGSRPALRITEEIAGILRRQSPGGRLGTYQCQRRGCGAIYDLLADDFLPEGHRPHRQEIASTEYRPKICPCEVAGAGLPGDAREEPSARPESPPADHGSNP